MRQKNTKKEDLKVEYTTRPVSGWGGLVVFARFLESIGVRSFLQRALPDGRTSNNQVGVVDMVLQLFVSVLSGGRRFEHVDRFREDEVIRNIMKVRRFGSASSITRYLGNFLQSQSEHAHTVLSELVFALAPSIASSDVLDLDSTVFTRYGEQEGSAKGYNPKRRGARSHHPLLAMLAKSKLIVHAWLREGSASPHKGACEFMTELISRLPKTFRIEALRADSGFYSRKFMTLLESMNVPYVIAAKMSLGFASWSRSRQEWTRIDGTTEVAEGMYKSPKTDLSRRIIVVRTTVRKIVKGVLFPITDYEYRAYATSMTDSAEQIVRFYKGRGDCENRIKELKYDFNADGFCLKNFAGTETTFRLICFLFNLVAIFKVTVLKDSRTTLGTVRTKVFVIGAAIGSSGRQTILRLGLQGHWRERFDRLLQAATKSIFSTAAYLTDLLTTPALEPPSPWRYRSNKLLLLLSN